MAAVGDDDKDTRSSESAIDAGDDAAVGCKVTRSHLTLRQAAAELRMSSRQVRDLLATGQLAGFWGRDERGAATAYVKADAVQALAERMERMTP
jgi:hypothetical protein